MFACSRAGTRASSRPARRRGISWRFRIAVLCGALAAGCDETFTPLAETDLQFSVFGYLDAAADTQWIRVMPIRPLRVTAPGPFPASVDLEEVGTGRVIELRDSAFRFLPDPELESPGVYLHNFWTTERITPDAEYRFTAVREGGIPAEAKVKTPPEYGVEVWIGQGVPPAADELRLTGVRHVAFVRQDIFFYDIVCGVGSQRVFHDTGSPESDVQTIPIPAVVEPRRGCAPPIIERQEILIVVSGEPWPRGPDYSPINLSVPESPSNVSNSLGFLGGVLTTRILHENCRLETEERIPPRYCRIRYDDSTATLTGIVIDARCGKSPVVGATVELREIEPTPEQGHRVRFMNTTLAGTYEIRGLEPGRGYALRVSRPSPDPIQRFLEFSDTLVFSVAEQASYDVPLQRERCG